MVVQMISRAVVISCNDVLFFIKNHVAFYSGKETKSMLYKQKKIVENNVSLFSLAVWINEILTRVFVNQSCNFRF